MLGDMTVWPAPAAGQHAAGQPGAQLADRRAALFTGGPRLGFVFRDRSLLAAPFPEPAPDLDAMRSAAKGRAKDAAASYRKFRTFLGLPSTLLLVLLLLADGCQANLTGAGPPVAPDLFVLIICAPGIVVTVRKWQRAHQAAASVSQVGVLHKRALGDWQQRAAAWRQAELGKLETAAEWGSAVLPDGSLRIDVFGGSLRGWQALLTTHGTSLLAAQPVLVIDLTGELAGQELAMLAAAAGVPTVSWLLPADLARSGLLTSLSPAEFADALTEAVHASGAPGDARAERGVDTRVLEQLHGALAVPSPRRGWPPRCVPRSATPSTAAR